MATTTGTQKQQEQEQKKPTEKRKPVFVKLDQLNPETNGHTLIAKVLSSNLVLQKGRPASQNPRQTRIAECLIRDETGTILFTARDDQSYMVVLGFLSCSYIKKSLREKLRPDRIFMGDDVELMKPGVTVIPRNAKIEMFKGSMRLAVDKWGRIEVTDPANFAVKEDNNLSLIEYELVNVVED